VFKVAFSKVDFDDLPIYIPTLIREQCAVKPNDSRVRNTIVAIMRQFVESNDSALYFVCDMSDGRQQNRFRLFSRWFNELGEGFDKTDFCVGDIYSAVMYRKGFADRVLVENLIRAYLGL
jgi:hypothetical protein